jgi:hypothetical protein
MKICNWEEWQSYRNDRGAPPWIKVHRSLMTNKKWAMLSDAEKGQLVSMWIAAADAGGELPDDPMVIKKICQLDEIPNLKRFNELGLIEWQSPQLDANLTPKRRQHDAPEESRVDQSRLDNNISAREKKLSTAPDLPDLPPCIPPPAWANWLAYRKQIRKPIAAATAKQQINKLAHWHAAGHDLTAIINTSIERGWTGLFEPQKNEAKNGKQPTENPRTKSENAAAQAVAELVRDGCFGHGRDDRSDF